MARFKRTTPQPQVKGTPYGRFRPYVRKDFEQCCAYCLRHESWADGEDGFELDHFRPKDPVKFPELENDFYNLYYSCHLCNKKKWNIWPTQTEIDNGGFFVDLCLDDFEKHYVVLSDGEMKALTTEADYTIKKLLLNRKCLKEQREFIMSLGLSFQKPMPTSMERPE